MSQDGAAQPLGSANPAALQRPRRQWWRWLLLLPVLYLVFDEVFTLIEFEPPYCGHAYYEMIEGETREAYRANLIRVLDSWGERYWEFEGGTLLRYDFEFLDDFAESFQQMRWQTVDRISRDTTINGVEYPAPRYLDEVRGELIEKYGPDRQYLEGEFIASSCEMMAAVVLTPESYALYRAAQGLPPLASLPPVPEQSP